ncbi:MAG: hypothetical protein L0216_13790, partial [Planctomycetales bacterium]|nr:hypothetical protein [Planctomycetales bacterium]
ARAPEAEPARPPAAAGLVALPAAPVPAASGDGEWVVRIAVAGASGADAALREPLLARVREIPGVAEAAWADGSDSIRVVFRGDLSALLARLARLSGPSLVLGPAELHVPATVRDDTPPSPKIFDPVEGAAIAAARIPVGVLVPDEDVVGVSVNGIPATRLPDQNVWRADVPCAEGANVLTAVARDRAGNEGRHVVRVGVDTTPPDVTANAVIRVHGRVDDPASRVTVNGKPVEVRGDGSYETLVALPPDGRVIVEATDSLGNKTTRILEFGGR